MVVRWQELMQDMAVGMAVTIEVKRWQQSNGSVTMVEMCRQRGWRREGSHDGRAMA